jgi:hypothetical protein
MWWTFRTLLWLWLAHAAIALPPNKIALENQLPGNPATEWDINGAGDPTIQGFATEVLPISKCLC